jgi:hypothetical protein
MTADQKRYFKEVVDGYGSTQVYDVSTGKNVNLFYINYIVPVQLSKGDYTITFGGI